MSPLIDLAGVIRFLVAVVNSGDDMFFCLQNEGRGLQFGLPNIFIEKLLMLLYIIETIKDIKWYT